MQSIHNHIMRIKCPIDMKQKVLEREFCKLSLYAKNYFNICPVLLAFARALHICSSFWCKLYMMKLNSESTNGCIII